MYKSSLVSAAIWAIYIYMFETSQRATYKVFTGDLVPAGTALATPALENISDLMRNITLRYDIYQIEFNLCKDIS